MVSNHDQMLFQFGDINLEVMERALALMIEKHETLRTSFDLYNFDQNIQIIWKEVPAKIAFEDISHSDRKEKELAVESFLASERKNHPFDIESAPLWRIKFFRVGPSDMIFVFQCHHAIIDGWSDATFRIELFRTYMELLEDANHRPETLKCSIRDSVISDVVEVQKPTEY